MSIRFYIQNAGWASLNPSEAYQAKKAMDQYRKLHPVCEITGSNKNVQVHHIIPIWARPDLAADPNNFISLSVSSNIHLILGHNGNYANRYVKNIKEISKEIRDSIKKSDVIERNTDISTLSFKPNVIWKAIKNWIKFIFKK